MLCQIPTQVRRGALEPAKGHMGVKFSLLLGADDRGHGAIHPALQLLQPHAFGHPDPQCVQAMARTEIADAGQVQFKRVASDAIQGLGDIGGRYPVHIAKEPQRYVHLVRVCPFGPWHAAT